VILGAGVWNELISGEEISGPDACGERGFSSKSVGRRDNRRKALADGRS